jgi:FkbM family methyltransferase
MINKLAREHPWLYLNFKKAYWPILRRWLKAKSYIYTNVDFDFKIKLIVNDESVSRRIFFNSYEKETVAFFRKLISPRDVIYDVGANIGFYSLIFSKLVGGSGQVHSFEPSRREFLSLAENVKLNCMNNVFLNQLAVSNCSGTSEMTVFNNQTFGAYNTLGRPNHHKVLKENARKEVVRTITLDNYYAMCRGLKPSIIKIDVEGAELSVLSGGKNLLCANDAPVLVLEICDETLEGLGNFRNEVNELLKEYSYNCFSLNPNGTLAHFDEKTSLNVVAAKQNSLSRFTRVGLTEAL